jgi:hypothetical protein
MVLKFDSMHAFMAAFHAKVRHHSAGEMPESWNLKTDWRAAAVKAVEGDPTLAGLADQTIEKINVTIGDVERPIDAPSVAGYRVVVPDFLGGNPRNMRKRAKAERQAQHVTIYVSVIASAGINAKDLLTRGSAILALVEALTMRRIGVDIYLLGEQAGSTGRAQDDVFTTIRVENRPLDLSTAAFGLAHPAFGRSLLIDWCIANGTPGHGPFPHASGYGQPEYLTNLAKILDAEPGSLFIPLAYLTDRLIFDAPERWVTERLEQLSLAQ